MIVLANGKCDIQLQEKQGRPNRKKLKIECSIKGKESHICN